MRPEENAPSVADRSLGLTRRQFLQSVAASTAGAVVFTGCRPDEHEFLMESRVSLAEDILSGYENWYATTCRQCGAGCGTIVRSIEGRVKKVEGNPDHPLNLGKLCARGQATVQEQYHPDRIQGPLKRSGNRGSGKFTAITWDEALDQLVGQLRRIQQQGRAGDVALLTGALRGHRASLVDQFAQAYGAQRFTWSEFPDAPLREAARRLFNQDALPNFDIRNARYVLSFGADFLGPWVSQVRHNLDYGMFRQGDYRPGSRFSPRRGTPRGYLVQVDSRFSATAANADEWIWVPPGTEGMLALGIANVLVAEGLADSTTAQAMGGAQTLSAYGPDRVERDTGVKADKIRQLARDFASRRPALAIGGGSAGAHTNGSDAVTAILALNALAGNIGRPGGVQFNPASALEGLPASARPTSFADWQRFADRLRSGSVQAVLVKDADIAHGAPAALGLRDALQKAPFLVSFSSFLDDTTAQADLVLPSHLPLEDWGDDIPEPAPGFQVLTIQQPVVRPAFDTRGFWDLLLVVADELGGRVRDALPWQTFKDVLRDGARTLQGQQRGNIRESDFEHFWERLLQQGGWWDESAAGPRDVAVSGSAIQQAVGNLARPATFAGSDSEFPYFLVVFPHNSLGGGELAHLPWLQATPDPVTSAVWQTWVEVNPKLAAQMGLTEGDVVAVESPQGRVEVPVYIHPAAPPKVLAMPAGQGHEHYGRWAEGRGAKPMDLVAPLTDGATGALAYGATRARITKTGKRAALPKYEGTAEAAQIPGEEVVKLARET